MPEKNNINTRPLIAFPSVTGFYMIGTLVDKGLNNCHFKVTYCGKF